MLCLLTIIKHSLSVGSCSSLLVCFIVKNVTVIIRWIFSSICSYIKWNDIIANSYIYYATGTVLDSLHVFSNFIPYTARYELLTS